MTYKLMRCTPCGGTGKVVVLNPAPVGLAIYVAKNWKTREVPCPACNGSGKGFR